MPDVTRIEYPNYSGLLFQKGNSSTPFSTLIGAQPVLTNATEFSTGVLYNAPVGEQPSISEEASLTAPDADPVKREQATNVTQIFQYTVSVSYAKESDMGTMSGINIANQTAEPPSELDFQVAQAMSKAQADIEYSFLRGKYAKATSKDTVNTTRGMLEAITTNVVEVGKSDAAAALTYWKVCEAMKCIQDYGGITDGLILGVSPVAALQLNKDASENQYHEGVVNIMGLNVLQVVTPLGTVNVQIMHTLGAKDSETSNTAILFNPAEVHPVMQAVPGKGNFFLEPLAKTGAGDKYQIFGQAGLDCGAEFHAAKLTNISNDLPTGTL